MVCTSRLNDTNVTRYGVYQQTANNNYLAGKLGIANSSPDVALSDITGVMRAIDDAAACTATERGAIRFNSAGAALQVCSGAAWGALGGGSSALSGITAATAVNSINSANFAQAWNWNTLNTQTALALSANAITSGKILYVSSSATGFTAGTMTKAPAVREQRGEHRYADQVDGFRRFQRGGR